jgi:CDP-6-deoxy-D-xylo-4-hexulose-3-dehydrase
MRHQLTAGSDDLIAELVAAALKERHQTPDFVPGETAIPVSGKVFGAPELTAAVNASLDFWLTSGPYAEEFESKLARVVGMRDSFMVNSGSSANLLALTSLTSPKHGDRALKPGDEVLTVAAGFPTTVTPILQNGLVPVYVDVDLGTYVANNKALEEAIGPKTKAIMMAHTLGNPFDLDLVEKLAMKHGLWLVEEPRQFRRPFHLQLLPCPPHHHWRRWRRIDKENHSQADR